MADGVYELNDTLTFTPADSGQRWSAANGACPVFSGGRQVRGWIIGAHAGQVAWSVILPEVAAGAWHFTQLWVNGHRRSRPRMPKTGFFRFTGLAGHADTGMTWMQGPDRAEYPEGSLSRFRNLADVRVISYQLWFDTHHQIKTLDEKRRVVHFHTRSIGSLCDESNQFARFFLMNVGESLSEPGEWYLDRTSGTLTYLPLPGETPETAVVVAPRLAEVVRFQGSRTSAVTGVVLEHLGLAHNEWSRGTDSCGTVQAAFDVPGGVVFERADNCVLYGCELAHLAGYGVEMLAGSHGNVIAACTIRELGAGAVKIGHENLRVHQAAVGEKTDPPARWLRTMATTIADCHLHDGGHIYPSAPGLWIGNAGANRVQHNHIHHFAYTGISCGWTWGYAPTRTWDNRIDFNHIHHINHLRVLSDNGGIYTLGIQPGSTVISNHVHDISSYHYGGQGLYPDEGSSGIRFEDNCVHHVAYYGFGTHYGCYLVARNNILAVFGRGKIDPGRAELSFGQIFERNLLTWTDCDHLVASAAYLPAMTSTANNLLYTDAPGGAPWTSGTLAAEQALGRWVGTVEADPLFADARSGDFTLRADSPALALGFKPFDWRRAGVRPQRERVLAWKDYRLPDAKPRALALAQLSPGALAITGDTAQLPLRVALHNPSASRVSGRWTLRYGDGSLAHVTPGPRLTADLDPGETQTHDVMVHLHAASGRQWVQVRGDERVSFSAAVPVLVPLSVPMPRQKGRTDLSVTNGLNLDIIHGGTAILTGHAAVVDDSIAIDVTVHEAVLRVDRAAPWLGSSLELFAATEPPPGEVMIPPQWILLPGDAHGSPEVRSVQGLAVDPALWHIETVPGGWRVRIRLPYAAFSLPHGAVSFRFDVIATVMSPIAGQNLLRLPRWGVPNNWANAASLVRVKIPTA